jgi:putative nucleotidyltransferase with HDIG domain
VRYAVDYLEPGTREHCYRVANIVKEIAEYTDIGLSPDIAFLCGLYHDVGKIYLPDRLLKSEYLNSADSEAVKEHVYFGHKFIMESKELINMNSGHKKMLALCAGYHHENGRETGYPRGYNINDLPLIVGLVAIVDIYDKMTQLERYKRIMQENIAVELIRAETGGTYSLRAGQIFIKWYKNNRKNQS